MRLKGGGSTPGCARAASVRGKWMRQTVAAAGLAIVAAAGSSFPAAPALAHSDSLSIDITARIKPRCGFTDGAPITATAPADLERAASLKLAVGLDCNTPYVLGVTAEKGALVNLDAAEDGSGYAFSKVYGVSVALETDRGVVRSGKCRSRDLVAGGRCDFAGSRPGKGLKSGGGVTIDGNAVLTIDWPEQTALPSRLAPGRYKDTLILVVGPRG